MSREISFTATRFLPFPTWKCLDTWSNVISLSIYLSLLCSREVRVKSPAGSGVSLSQLKYRRLICLTDLHTMLTPAGKSTALRRRIQIRRSTWNRDQLLIFLGINSRKAAKKSHCIGMSRVVEDISYGTFLHNLTC